MTRSVYGVRVCAAAVLAMLAAASETTAASCASLSSVSLPNASIKLAQEVAAGAFAPVAPVGARGTQGGGRGAVAGRGPAPQFGDLPAFCRVLGSIATWLTIGSVVVTH